MKHTKELKQFKLKILTFQAIINFILSACTYIIMPAVLSYPPFVENNFKFQNYIETFNHLQQYILIYIISVVIFFFIVNQMLKKIYKFIDKYYRKENFTYNEIKKVRNDCFKIPYLFYISIILITFALGITVNLFFKISNIILVKFALMFITIITLICLLDFMFLQKLLKSINLLTYSITVKFEKYDSLRLKFSTNLILQIIPFLSASIIIISLIGYAKTTEEHGNSIMNYYKAYLQNRNFDTVSFENIKNELDSIPLNSPTDYYLIIPPDKNDVYSSDNTKTVSPFFFKYLEYFFDKTNGQIYEYYGTEEQAYLIKLQDNQSKNWYVGFHYATNNMELFKYYIGIILGVSLLYGIFIYFWSRSISTNITTISESLKYVSKEKDYGTQRFLPIYSNDEFGDLAYYYNKIEEMTNEHLKEIQENQDILVEQERLASLRSNDWWNST